MAWIAPITFVANNVLTAEQLNDMLVSNMERQGPAIANSRSSILSTAGDNIVSTSAPIFVQALNEEFSTTSTSFVHLAGMPTITIETTGRCVVGLFGCLAEGAEDATRRAIVSFEAVGGGTPSDSRSIQSSWGNIGPNKMSCIESMNVVVGTVTFRMMIREGSSGGTAKVASPAMLVIPF